MLYVSRPEVRLSYLEDQGSVIALNRRNIKGLTKPLLRTAYTAEDLLYLPVLLTKPVLPFRSVASGKRSFIVNIGNRDYRIKGGAFNPSEFITEDAGSTLSYVEGGGSLEQANYEKKYADAYSLILEKIGLRSAMKVVGFFDYGIRVDKRKIGAPVIEIEGDTRLDEFFEALEVISPEGLESKVRILYKHIGNCVGSLLRLLHSNSFVWSTDPEYTNAHIGNVVLHGDAQEDLKINLADFEGAFLKKELTDTEFLDAKEYDLGVKDELYDMYSIPIKTESKKRWRDSFARGVLEAYENPNKRKYNVDRNIVDDVFSSLPVKEVEQNKKLIIGKIARPEVHSALVTVRGWSPQDMSFLQELGNGLQVELEEALEEALKIKSIIE